MKQLCDVQWYGVWGRGKLWERKWRAWLYEICCTVRKLLLYTHYIPFTRKIRQENTTIWLALCGGPTRQYHGYNCRKTCQTEYEKGSPVLNRLCMIVTNSNACTWCEMWWLWNMGLYGLIITSWPSPFTPFLEFWGRICFVFITPIIISKIILTILIITIIK